MTKTAFPAWAMLGTPLSVATALSATPRCVGAASLATITGPAWNALAVQGLARKLLEHPALQLPALWAPSATVAYAATTQDTGARATLRPNPADGDAVRYECARHDEGDAATDDPFARVRREAERLEGIAEATINEWYYDIIKALNPSQPHLREGVAILSASRAEYVRRVLDPLARYLEEASITPHYCCFAVLQALIIIPADHLDYLDRPKFRTTQLDTGSAVEHLQQLLGCVSEGKITTLFPAEVARLYRALRPNPRWACSRRTLNLLYQCRTREDLLLLLDFEEWFDNLSFNEQACFVRYYSIHRGRGPVLSAEDAPADLLHMEDIRAGVVRQYLAANTPEALRERIAQLRTGNVEHRLLQLGLPVAEAILSTAGDAPVPRDLPLLVSALEIKARYRPSDFIAKVDDDLTPNDLDWIADMDLLEDSFSVLMDECKNKYEKDTTMRDLKTFAWGLANHTPEPLRTVVLARLLAEAVHPNWQIRAMVLFAIQEAREVGAEMPSYLAICERGLRDDAPWVRLRAIEAIMPDVPSLPPAQRTAVASVLEQLLVAEDPACVKEAIAACHQLLPALPTAAQSRLARALWALAGRLMTTPSPIDGEDSEGDVEINDEASPQTPLYLALNAAWVLCRQSASIPAGLATRIGRQNQLPDLVARGLASKDQSEHWLAERVWMAYVPLVGNPMRKREYCRRLLQRDAPQAAAYGTLILDDHTFRYLMTHVPPDKRQELFADLLDSELLFPEHFELNMQLVTRITSALLALLRLIPSTDRLACLDLLRKAFNAKFAHLPPEFDDATISAHRHFLGILFVHFLSIAVREIPEWQSEVLLTDFAPALGAQGVAAWQAFTAGLARRHYPRFYEVLFRAHVKSSRTGQLLRYLLDKVQNREQFRNTFAFVREFLALPHDVQDAFANTVAEESCRTAIGAGRAITPDAEPLWRFNAAKALQRLRSWLIARFVWSLDQLSGYQKEQVRADLQRRTALWQQGYLLHHLAALASFSSREGQAAIIALVQQLQSGAAQTATSATSNHRLMNPQRYESVRELFAPAFIERWANGGNDCLIPLGHLGMEDVLRNDPRALLRAEYDYAARQMANHLNVPGVSHLEGEALCRALQLRITQSTAERAALPAHQEWGRRLKELVQYMAQEESLTESDVEAVLQPLQDNSDLSAAFGPDGSELRNDLQQLKLSLAAEAVNGNAWLIITDNPADMVGAGRDPVTCQDPTRNTGHNQRGQPVNRPRDGRFLYAKVVIAEQVTLQNGVAVLAPESEVVARTHLEATTETGRPDPAADPHVLGERLYAHPGFIYRTQVAAGLNCWVRDMLQLDPERQAHWQFVMHNMRNVPPHLPDTVAIYRDTFR